MGPNRAARWWKEWADVERWGRSRVSVRWLAVGQEGWLESQELGTADPAGVLPHQSIVCWSSSCGASEPTGAGAATVAAGLIS